MTDLSCVGWGPHLAATAAATGQYRLCWACEARGYVLIAAPDERLARRTEPRA